MKRLWNSVNSLALLRTQNHWLPSRNYRNTTIWNQAQNKEPRTKLSRTTPPERSLRDKHYRTITLTLPRIHEITPLKTDTNLYSWSYPKNLRRGSISSGCSAHLLTLARVFMQRIRFVRTSKITFKILYFNEPAYLRCLLQIYKLSRNLWSSNHKLLTASHPRTALSSRRLVINTLLPSHAAVDLQTFVVHKVWMVFAARCFASAAYVVMRCVSVCLCVCVRHVRTVSQNELTYLRFFFTIR